MDGFYYVQSLHGHKSDINGLIELKDGRIASSSKDRTIRIWKSFNTVDKNNHNVINFEVNEILSEYPHGIYGLIQLDDGRIVSSTNEFSLIVWKDNKFLSYFLLLLIFIKFCFSIKSLFIFRDVDIVFCS